MTFKLGLHRVLNSIGGTDTVISYADLMEILSDDRMSKMNVADSIHKALSNPGVRIPIPEPMDVCFVEDTVPKLNHFYYVIAIEH
jgi:hypothetical protein